MYKGGFGDWPRLSDRMTVGVLVKAWRGQYEYVDEVAVEVGMYRETAGHRVLGIGPDEITCYPWENLLEVLPYEQAGRIPILRFKKGISAVPEEA